MTSDIGRAHRTSRIITVVALVVGLLVGVLCPVPSASVPGAFKALVGFTVGALVYTLTMLGRMMRMDAAATKAHLHGLGGDRTEVDLAVLVASFGAIAAIAFMLLGGGKKSSGEASLEAAVTILAVAAAWLSIHTSYTLRYAKHWYNVEPHCIDFNGDDDPQFSDFAYVAFDLGMTYQISDTNLNTSAVRRIVFGHTLLSYVFGTGIVASAINLVVGLAS